MKLLVVYILTMRMMMMTTMLTMVLTMTVMTARGDVRCADREDPFSASQSSFTMNL